ncbi:MAG: NosD domain-containing protein, partial [Thermoplasmata archaeon]
MANEKQSKSNNNITYNNCSGNSWYGIKLSSSNYNNITYNNFYHNTDYAIYITTSSTGNIIHHNNFWQNNGAGKGVSGNCQAYDDVGGNYWNDNIVNEGNYWSNWDKIGAYPIDGGAGASDNYPLSSQVSEFSGITAIAMLCMGILLVV